MELPLNYNIFNIIIVFGSIQGLIFGIIIIRNTKFRRTSNFYLSLVVLFLSLNNLYYWFLDTGLSNYINNYEFLYLPLKLLVLPMYFFFVTAYLNLKEDYKKLKKLILSPFYIFLVTHLLFKFYRIYIGDKNEQILYFEKTIYYTEEYFSALFSIFIIIKSFILIKKHEKSNTNYSLKKVNISTKWLKQLLFLGVIICLIWIAIVFFNQLNNYNLFGNYNKYFLWVSITFLLYWIAYLGIYYNDIFKQRVKIRKKNSLKSKEINYQKKSTIENIREDIYKEKAFLNPNLSLHLLAKKYDLNESYLSQIFNRESEINFPTFINKLRIEESKRLLINEEYNSYDIISIGLEAGFNSKSVFYSIFKRETGLTPSQYRKQNLS